jgi:hypothetical protein
MSNPVVLQPGRRGTAVMSGVANALVADSQLDTPASHEGRAGIGSGLGDPELQALTEAVATVADSARCNLAIQQQVVINSMLASFPDAVRAHLDGDLTAVEPEVIAAILDLENGTATLDEHELTKQPDWTYDPVDSGQWPTARLDDHRMAHEDL